ncbi:MAG: hypothetical protein D6679_02830 [Candidatus Hydrogenedentota bacterium]|nr:MAG: hypothetical protein D6679_02830 [Candidatus Hydrogenedentota bacterium]
MKRIEIYDTTLRDSAHALKKAPMKTGDQIALASAMDSVGFSAAEIWGGATFDSCLRINFEDPWERLAALSRTFQRTPLRILLRGQNLLGYHPMPRDIIEIFSRAVAAHGITLARVYDSLNDVDNLEVVVGALKAEDIRVEGALIYTQSPVHSNDRFVEDALRLKKLGCDAVCLIDITGILTPGTVREIVSRVAKEIPVALHIRSAGGMAPVAYGAAIVAGASGLDCTVAPMSLAASLPSVQAILESLDDDEYETTIDPEALKAYTKKTEAIAIQRDIDSDGLGNDQASVTVHKIPFGMMSGLITELKELNAARRLNEVLAEVTRVREDFGWPPLITPISQMVAAQAVHNVLSGSRYSLISREVRDYLRGLYGRPPGEINPDLLSGITPLAGRTSLLLPPQADQARRILETEGLFEKEEDLLTFAMYGPVAQSFFRYRKDPRNRPPRGRTLEPRLRLLTEFMRKKRLTRLEIGEEDFRIKLVKSGSAARRPASVSVPVDEESTRDEASLRPPEPRGTPIPAPLGGTFYRAPSPTEPPFAEPGQEVTADTVIGLVEAMKLFHEVKAGQNGRLKEFAIENACAVDAGAPIAYLEDAESGDRTAE